ncbi:MAG TPA: DUF4159 domain-containing protein [Longimicrobiales bacterium]|nr:DUF4159 domain-containing protein [Longimicrobiales bacterium]
MRRTVPAIMCVAVLSLGASASGREPAPTPAERHSFQFTRAVYTSGGWGWGRRGGAWATDYPKADLQFLVVARRVTNLDAYPEENAIRLDDPALRRHPFLYAVEVGQMALTDAEVAGLRSHLLAGGFLVVDDFWGTYQWEQFERNIRRVFPDRPIEELASDDGIFRAFYRIDEVVQVPSINNIRRGRTWEQDGYVPRVFGIRAEDGRLMVVINWNTDLGDAWEWAEQPDYPLVYSTFAYQMGVNLIVHAMSH